MTRNSGNNNRGIYLYCVTEATNSLPPLRGIDDNFTTFQIKTKPLAALVSEVPLDAFTGRTFRTKLRDLSWAESKLRAHEACVRAAKDSGSVLPMRFATIFSSETELKEWLEQTENRLTTLLQYFQHKEEWGVQIICHKKEYLSQIRHVQNPEIKAIDAQLVNQTPGQAFFLTKKKEQKLDALRESILTEACQELNSQLDRIAIKKVDLDVSRSGESQDEQQLVLNTSLLIEETSVGRLQDMVGSFNEAPAVRGLRARYTGPWSPYNFVSALQPSDVL